MRLFEARLAQAASAGLLNPQATASPEGSSRFTRARFMSKPEMTVRLRDGCEKGIAGTNHKPLYCFFFDLICFSFSTQYVTASH